MSTVDVVVPCYQYGHFLKDCVESVLAQSGPALRVLIIDDASHDCTANVAEDLVRADTRVEFRKHSSNQGHIATFNEGIAWATADYMVLLSADDYLLPGALSRSADLMDDHPSVGFTFGCGIVREEEREDVIIRTGLGPGNRIMSGLDFIKHNHAKNIVLSPTAMVRTSLQKTLGGYLADLTHTSDMEMWLRFAAHGDVGVIDANQAVYRRHSINMSKQYSPEQDLIQRKVAIEHFLNSCAAVLANVDDLRIWLTCQLALDAISCASAAFNEGAMERSERLSRLALEFDPAVRRSHRWWLLACKRSLGLRGWQRLRPAVDWLRSVSRKQQPPQPI